MSKKGQCHTCGRPVDTPNFAYHVCAEPRIGGKTALMLYGAVKAAVNFDKTTQYVMPEGSAVIMSARKYRELIGEELPNTPVRGVMVVDEVSEKE